MQEAFKFYKSKKNENKWPNLIDCCTNFENVEKVTESELNFQAPVEYFGLKPIREWKIYKTNRNVIVIKNPFLGIAQRYWIVQCLRSYTKYPNKNNLLENQFERKVIEDFWNSWLSADDNFKRKLKKSFRWTTLGYHYDWTNKIYDENLKNDFPADLYDLMQTIASALNFNDFKSEAAIINFYPIGTTLSSHSDHSELDLESPLISLSLGQDAIFLAGGLEKDTEPVLPFKLSSGDILIMAKESRLIYHAVPKIFKTSEEPWNKEVIDVDYSNFSKKMDRDILKICSDSNSFSTFNNYLSDLRINLNVRQVLPKGIEKLN